MAIPHLNGIRFPAEILAHNRTISTPANSKLPIAIKAITHLIDAEDKEALKIQELGFIAKTIFSFQYTGPDESCLKEGFAVTLNGKAILFGYPDGSYKMVDDPLHVAYPEKYEKVKSCCTVQ